MAPGAEKPTPVAITVKDLCVIDCDTPGQAAALEARFPDLLKGAPCERTRRGFHFLFGRPPEADEAGFYDGAAQREQGVDLKTVTSTGTGGIVLLSPSPDKAWLPGRAPWECAPNGAPPIPLELLNAVALPRHVGVDARLVFTETADGSLVAPGEPEEELVVRGCRYLLAMDYFSAALSGRWSTGQGAVGGGGGGGGGGGARAAGTPRGVAQGAPPGERADPVQARHEAGERFET